jgi:hypothetical protein
MTASTVTKVTTVRDKLNSQVLGKASDTANRAPLGDILAAMLDVLNPNSTIAAITAGGAVASTGVTSPANASYTQGDQTALATCVLALVVQINLIRADIIALRNSVATVASGHVGGVTDSGLTVTSNVATLSATPTTNGMITVRATTGTTTGVKTLRRDPLHTLVTGEVFWDGQKGLTFAAVDAVTACDVIYAKADLSQKVSCLMTAVTE